ncbi:MAG TPA: hypothetical protein VK030_04230 [Actinomycetales bacterium]|nr:hypothetical protein [Actinomycetales bacterium]
MDKRVSNKTSLTVLVGAIVAIGLNLLNNLAGIEVGPEYREALIVVGVGAIAYFVPADKGKYVVEAAKYTNLAAPLIEEATGIDVLEDLADDELEDSQPDGVDA